MLHYLGQGQVLIPWALVDINHRQLAGSELKLALRWALTLGHEHYELSLLVTFTSRIHCNEQQQNDNPGQ